MASDFLLVEAIALDFLGELEINSIGLLQAHSLSRSLSSQKHQPAEDTTDTI